MIVAVFATSVYGGYFGAGQGVILLALMAILMAEPLQQVNALKNVLQGVDNVASALMFVFIARVEWLVVALLAGGAIVGGQAGAKVGRRLPPNVLRAFIVVVGVAGIIQLVRYILLAVGVPDAAALVAKAGLIVGAVWLQRRGRAA